MMVLFRFILDYTGLFRDYSGLVVIIWDYSVTICALFVAIRDYFEEALMNLTFHDHVCKIVWLRSSNSANSAGLT